MVDADIGTLETAEEALDLVGVRAVLGAVSGRVVHPLHLIQADEVVVARVLKRFAICRNRQESQTRVETKS